MSASAGDLLPDLSKTRFVSGRAATADDINSGAAVFELRDGETPIGSPIEISVPQYALFNNEGTSIPVVIIQAEQTRGQRLIGAIDTSGKPIVGLFTDFTLLGTQKPSPNSNASQPIR